MSKISKVFFSSVLSFMLVFSFYPIKTYAANVKTQNNIQQGNQVVAHGQITIKTNNVSSQANNISLQANNGSGLDGGVGVVTISWNLQSNYITHTISDRFEITNIYGQAPTEVVIDQWLKCADDSYPLDAKDYHSKFEDNLLVDWKGSDVRVGNSKTEVIPAQTKFWTIFGEAMGFFYHPEGYKISTETWLSDPVAINKSGVIFPVYVDSWSNRDASKNIRTDWVKVPESQRVQWTSDIIAEKRTEYENTYMNGQRRNWNGLQLHHIQPRAYGGSNSLNNLLAVPDYVHTAITSWFAGY